MKTKKKNFIIREYCNGGTIKENIEKYKIKYGKPFSEKIAQHILKQLFDVVNYLQGIYSEEAKNNLDIFKSDIKLTNFRTVKCDNKIDIRKAFCENNPKK